MIVIATSSSISVNAYARRGAFEINVLFTNREFQQKRYILSNITNGENPEPAILRAIQQYSTFQSLRQDSKFFRGQRVAAATFDSSC